ncbi:hypothetical protein, partial [Plasmodium yoelii yoelii]
GKMFYIKKNPLSKKFCKTMGKYIKAIILI